MGSDMRHCVLTLVERKTGYAIIEKLRARTKEEVTRAATRAIRRHCHNFVYIPAYHCLNLSAAVDVVLYDRMAKRQLAGEEPMLPITAMLHEDRGICEVLSKVGWEGE